MQIAFCHFLARVKFPPRDPMKKFAYDMVARASTRPAQTLTLKQHKYLCRVVVRFHRQIHPKIVDDARKELARLAAEETAC
ncbi:hypothetical protein [Alicycliphilus denitrificans]|uniref:hypothetical protein n=1 Tax=Alicycliphilus denitrificans TaxID=179636 RepID=UPI000C9F427C|nr:hypothetical protein [Alicycliphilus denitrificans]